MKNILTIVAFSVAAGTLTYAAIQSNQLQPIIPQTITASVLPIPVTKEPEAVPETPVITTDDTTLSYESFVGTLAQSIKDKYDARYQRAVLADDHLVSAIQVTSEVYMEVKSKVEDERAHVCSYGDELCHSLYDVSKTYEQVKLWPKDSKKQ